MPLALAIFLEHDKPACFASCTFHAWEVNAICLTLPCGTRLLGVDVCGMYEEQGQGWDIWDWRPLLHFPVSLLPPGSTPSHLPPYSPTCRQGCIHTFVRPLLRALTHTNISSLFLLPCLQHLGWDFDSDTTTPLLAQTKQFWWMDRHCMSSEPPGTCCGVSLVYFSLTCHHFISCFVVWMVFGIPLTGSCGWDMQHMLCK